MILSKRIRTLKDFTMLPSFQKSVQFFNPGPNFMNLNCLTLVQILITDSNPSITFKFESVVQI